MTTYIFNDDVKTTLLNSISESATTISVKNPVGVYNDPPSPGVGEIATLKVVDRIDNPSRREIITYTGRSAITGGFALTGVTRGDGDTTALLWEAGCYVVGLVSADYLATLASSGDIPSTTDDLPEGTTNLYFTEARVVAALSDRLATFVETLGTESALECVFDPPITSLTPGLVISVLPAFDNFSGEPTFTPNAGTITGTRIFGMANGGTFTTLHSGDLRANRWAHLIYSAFQGGWILLNPLSGAPQNIDDWNSGVISGTYVGASAANSPYPGRWFGSVIGTIIPGAVKARQTLSNDDGSSDIYTRQLAEGVWTPWVSLATQADLDLKLDVIDANKHLTIIDETGGVIVVNTENNSLPIVDETGATLFVDLVVSDQETVHTFTTYTASHTLTLADASTISNSSPIVEMNVATANTLTVPPNSSVEFVIGSKIDIVQIGTGQTTITPGSGVTIYGTPGLKLRAQYSGVTLIKKAINTWYALGDMTA